MSNILDSQTKEIPESAEYMYKEIQEIMYENEDFHNGIISKFYLRELFYLINCKNYQKSTLYIELLEKFCKNEMNPNICIDIIIDYKENNLKIIPKIQESFIYNLKKILIDRQKNNQNHHFAKIEISSTTFFLSEFKKIIENMDDYEFENHFLEIISGISYFDKHKDDLDSMDKETKIKWMIGASFYKILQEIGIKEKTKVDVSQNNCVTLKPENPVSLSIGIDPRVKISNIGGNEIRYNGFLAEELQHIIQEYTDELKTKVEEITIGIDISNKANLSKENLLQLKEARETYYNDLLEEIVISEGNQTEKEEKTIILNSLSHFYNINHHYSGEKTAHSEIKRTGFNKFLIDGIKRQLKKKVGAIFKEDTITGIAGLILRKNYEYTEEVIADYISKMIYDAKDILIKLERLKNINELVKKIKGTDFEFLTYYESNISRNNIGIGIVRTPLLLATEIFRIKYHGSNPNNFYISNKDFIVIDRIEIYIKILKECLADQNPRIKHLIRKSLFYMVSVSPTKRAIK